MNDDRTEAERAAPLDALAASVRVRATANRSFKSVIGPLEEDLAYLAAALRTDPRTWRLNRAFHAVHVPSLLAILSMLEDVEAMQSVTVEDRHQIDASLHRACGLVSEARQRVEQAALDATKIELEVLAGYARPPVVPFKRPSLARRTWTGMKSAPGGVWAVTRGGARAVPRVLGALRHGAAPSAARLTALPRLAANLRRTLSGAVSDSIAKPIEMRLQAGARALKYGVGTGLGVGVACAILFPPLLPVSAAGAVLGAMRGWRSEMDAARKLHGAERDRRIAALQAERRAALLELTGGAAAVQMESNEVSVALNVETGQADAVILRGVHTGRNWSELNAIEKAEVASLFADGTEVLIRLLEPGTDGA